MSGAGAVAAVVVAPAAQAVVAAVETRQLSFQGRANFPVGPEVSCRSTLAAFAQQVRFVQHSGLGLASTENAACSCRPSSEAETSDLRPAPSPGLLIGHPLL